MASPDIPEFGLQGAARPSDFSGDYNSLLFTIRQVLAKVNVATMVKVVAVNGSGLNPVGYVNVQPLVNLTDGYGKVSSAGVLYNIPYLRLQGGANAIIIDPQVGDIGICVFADKDISSVKKNKAQSNPGSRRRFDVADALYLGGVLNGTPNQYVNFSTGKIEIVGTGEIDITGPTKVNINSPWINPSSWVGLIAPFAMGAVPQGWLACPTAQTLVSTTTYADLFAAIGYTWGGSGGSFGLPYFEPGYTILSGVGVGVVSHGKVKDHTHPYTTYAALAVQTGSSTPCWTGTQTVQTGNPASPEGGPDNLAAGRGVQLCVKY